MKSDTQYMNIRTGEVDPLDGWWYEDEETGLTVNAVERGEVVAVRWNGEEYEEI